MIRLTHKEGSQPPDVLKRKGVNETEKIKVMADAGDFNFSFDSDIYGHKTVKETLVKLQAGKCCFCEAKIDHISYGDVEHFRPKAAWVQEDEALNKPGYYWLAYDWDNLFLSCQLCNQRNKKNYFPLENPVNRSSSYKDSIEVEAPLFIHPVNDDPEMHITFNQEVPKPLKGSLRGKITIEKLGLDREKLNDHRREKLTPIKQLYNIVKDYPPSDNLRKQGAKAVILEYFQKSKSDDTEYASMLRSFFLNNPIDF